MKKIAELTFKPDFPDDYGEMWFDPNFKWHKRDKENIDKTIKDNVLNSINLNDNFTIKSVDDKHRFVVTSKIHPEKDRRKLIEVYIEENLILYSRPKNEMESTIVDQERDIDLLQIIRLILTNSGLGNEDYELIRKNLIDRIEPLNFTLAADDVITFNKIVASFIASLVSKKRNNENFMLMLRGAFDISVEEIEIIESFWSKQAC